MSRPPLWKPEARPQDCWDWMTPEDILRHALAALYLARQSMKQPPGRRFAEADGTRWASREHFADNLALCFEMRIKSEGYSLGVHPPWADEAERLERWANPTAWHADELQHPEP